VIETLKAKIRDIPDFPTKGIVFKDITPLLLDGQAFRSAIDLLGNRYQDGGVEVVAGIEARGLIIASALAYRMGAGLAIVRKPGKLPYKTHRAAYELEYGSDAVEVHQDAIRPGERVLIADDLIATGGTAKAVLDLVEQMGGEVVGAAFLIELTSLKGRERLKGCDVFSLIQF